MKNKLESLTISELIQLHQHIIFLGKELATALELDNPLLDAIVSKEQLVQHIVKYMEVGQLLTEEIFVNRIGIKNDKTV